MKKLILAADANGENVFALPSPDYVSARVLAGSAESITVPSGARFVVFSATADFYAAYDATAAAATDTDDGTASELNPSVRYIEGVSSISVIGTASVTAAFYS